VRLRVRRQACNGVSGRLLSARIASRRRWAGMGIVAGSQGQALVELALAIPMLLLLIALAFNFGGWLWAWIQVGNAARAAANYAALGPDSLGMTTFASATTLGTLISTDLTSLPNYTSSNPAINICTNNNGTVRTISGTCSSSCSGAPTASCTPKDPENPTYVAITVDISYTYTSFFTGNRLLGLPLTVLPSTIHKRIVMRYL
jgi:Flp pilus assembly protein TadG